MLSLHAKQNHHWAEVPIWLFKGPTASGNGKLAACLVVGRGSGRRIATIIDLPWQGCRQPSENAVV